MRIFMLDLKSLNIKVKISKIKRQPRKIEVGEISHMEILFSWIKKLGRKKMTFKHSYFNTALLTNQAEIELQTKQRLRRNRWIELKANFLKDIHYGSCGQFNLKEEERNVHY
ncbi:hypothetical protein HN011_009614 [Eciton burchellii]|nr:hypothetical protein HN011_009614 [Eciton burchellii]